MSGTTAFTNNPAQLPRWTNVVLIIALGWTLAVLSMSLLPNTDTNSAFSTTIPASIGATNSTTNVEPTTLAQITAGLHIFGTANSIVEPPPPPPPPPQPVGSKLNLKLTGVLAYAFADKAIAIISNGSNEQSAYGIGDTLVDGVTLQQVYKYYVVINNHGTEEIIELSEDKITGVTRTSTSNTNANAQRTNQADSDLSSTTVELPTDPTQLRKRIKAEPSILNKIVSAQPYQENGKLIGYTISPKQNPEILEAYGIFAGDVLTRINNIQLNNQRQGIRALRNAARANILNIVVLRNGVEVPVSIAFDE